jgi:hypothetical protein
MLKNYDLSPLVNPSFLSKSDFIRLSLLKINPLFLSFVPFFVREMLRIFKCCVAVVDPTDLPSVQNLNTFLKVFPRLPQTGFIKKSSSSFNPLHYKALTKSLNYVVSKLPDSKRVLTDQIRNSSIEDTSSLPNETEPETHSSLLALSLGQLALKNRRINLRLVIVGNSSTSLGILSHFLSLKDLVFNNIILLSSEFKEQKNYLNVSPSESCTELDSLKGLFLNSKIKMIQGKMVSLDRKNKSIGVQDISQENFTLHYDYLVITTGLVDKTRDFLKKKDVFNNVFVMELEKVDSSQNLNNLSSNTSANMSVNPPINHSSQFVNDKNRKISINGFSENFGNQNLQSMLSYKQKNSTNLSSRNNFSNNSNVHQNEDENMLFYSTQNKKVSTDFFVSVDDIQGDIVETVLQKQPTQSPSNLSKKGLFSLLEKDRGWKGKLLHKKIPQNATLYGESPKIFTLLESLLKDFDMDASKISLLIPGDVDKDDSSVSGDSVRNMTPPVNTSFKTKMSNLADLNCEDNDKLLETFDAKVDSPATFENEEIREFYLAILEFFGINVIRQSEIMGLCEQENSILIRKLLDTSVIETKSKSVVKSNNKRNSFKTDLEKLEIQETQKNQVDSQFLNFVHKLKKFKYFFDFNMLSADVIEDLLHRNPNLVTLLDDYNLEKKVAGLIKTLTEEDIEDQTNSQGNSMPGISSQKLAKKPYGLNTNVNEEGDDMIQDTIVFMGRTFDVGNWVFNAIQENGLVYNGRLIVTNNFRTIDTFIYACGKISEFSKRYKNHALGRSLRVDKFDGFEVGKHFANQFVTKLRGYKFKEGMLYI